MRRSLATAVRVSLVLSGLCAALIAAEAIARLFPQFSFERMTVHHRMVDRNCARNYRPSRQFGFELIPHVGRGVNGFGMRDREYTLERTPGTFRILLLGDSVTEISTWSDMVEERLGGAAGRLEILNAAVSGWGLYNYRRYLELKGLSFAPDLVLLAFCLNDLDPGGLMTMTADRNRNITFRYAVLGADERPDQRLTLAIDPMLFRHSALYRMVVYARRSARSPVTDRELNERVLREMQVLARGRIAAIIYPFLKPVRDYQHQELRDYHELRHLLQTSGIPYIDLTGKFGTDARSMVPLRYFPDDPVHFGPAGDAVLARLLQPWVSGQIARSRARISNE